MENHTSLNKILLKLEDSKEVYKNFGLKSFGAGNGKMYSFDLFVFAIIERSILLTAGFCSLINQNNFLSAAPLVRMHLDNLLNIHAAFISPNVHDFSIKKLQGEQTKKMKDYKGAFMTDTYLAESLSKEKETVWVINLYRESSKFIHVSDKHMFSMTEKGKGDNCIRFTISEEQIVPEKLVIEASEAMYAISEQIFRHLDAWIKEK